MSKIYQPIVIQKTNQFINYLIENNFFEDYDIENQNFAKEYLLDKLTIKFIDGTLLDEDELIFDEEEFNVCLREIIAGSLLYSLKDKGYVDSYEDDDTEEVFFLTERGKEYMNELRNKIID